MKKCIPRILFLLIFALAMFTPMKALATESVVIGISNQVQGSEQWRIVTITVVAAANGSVTSTAFRSKSGLNRDIPVNIQYAEVIPGTATPQTACDITITNTNGTDVFDAALTNIDTSKKSTIEPTVPYIRTNLKDLTFNMSGNNVDSAQIVVKLYVYVRGD